MVILTSELTLYKFTAQGTHVKLAVILSIQFRSCCKRTCTRLATKPVLCGLSLNLQPLLISASPFYYKWLSSPQLNLVSYTNHIPDFADDTPAAAKPSFLCWPCSCFHWRLSRPLLVSVSYVNHISAFTVNTPAHC